jgi:uncharacterized protein
MPVAASLPVRSSASALNLRARPSPVGTINVRLQPRAARDEIVGERGGALLVSLTAPPLENRANAALCRLLARRLGIAPTRLSLLHGARSRDKVVQVEGLTSAEIAAALLPAQK